MPQFSIRSHESAAIPRRLWRRLCPVNHPFSTSISFASWAHGAAGRLPAAGWRVTSRRPTRDGTACASCRSMHASTRTATSFTTGRGGGITSSLAALYPKLLSVCRRRPGRALPDRSSGRRSIIIRQAPLDGVMALAAEYGVSSRHVAFPDDEDGMHCTTPDC